MHRYLFFISAILLLLGTSKLLAQSSVARAPQDYFSAIASENTNTRTYAMLVTSAHVDSVPKWLSTGQINPALSDIRYALDRFPNHPVSLQQLSMVAQMIKNTSLAIEYFERATNLYPQYAITRTQYGLFLVAINDIDAGIEKFKQAIEIDSRLSAGYAGLAHAYAKKSDFDHAREAAQKARELGFTGKLPDGL